MKDSMYIEISDNHVPFFSDIVIENSTKKWVADNCSFGYSAIKSYMELASRDEILTISLPQVGIILMIMDCEDGVLNWVFGTHADVNVYIENLNPSE